MNPPSTRIAQRVFILSVGLLTVSCLSKHATGLRTDHRLAGFLISPFFDEQVTSYTLEPGIHITVNAPSPQLFDPEKPTELIFYALPNGNSTAWTFGKKTYPGDDWHFDIQHIGAQTRRLREVMTDRNLVVAYLEAEGRSWPAWRRKHAEQSGPRILAAVESVKDLVQRNAPDSPVTLCLDSHSGGGSFIFGYLNQVQRIPDDIIRIAFLDSDYGYSDDDHHGDIFLEWLHRNPRNHLVVVAYDDREITFNGKKVVGPTGGTYRATHRMLDRFQKDITLHETRQGDVVHWSGMEGQIDIRVHLNPENKILHTVLVGPMNGFIHSITAGTKYQNKAAVFNGPPAFEEWIQDEGPSPRNSAEK
jgi:hypothetical protein